MDTLQLLKVESMLGKIYKSHRDPNKRAAAVLQEAEPYFRHISKEIISNDKIEEIKQALEKYGRIEDQKEFVKKVMEALSAVFALRKTNPKEYEEGLARAANEKAGYIELNRVVSYEKKRRGIIALHHSSAKMVNPLRLNALYKEAMKKLAKIVAADPEVRQIEAISWIVAKAPALFTENGFTVERMRDLPNLDYLSPVTSGDMKDQQGKRIALAVIKREDFLNRFLEKNDNGRI